MPKKGQFLSQEARDKISLSRIGRFKGKDNPNWKGGRMLIDGYWYIYSPDHPYRTKSSYVAEHRLILENKIKRHLKPAEAVHHINGIRTDNRKSNLVLCQSTGKHSSGYHIKRNQFGNFLSLSEGLWDRDT